MTTETDEQQVKEFLKRAEVRTMRKDLQRLREFDALKERDKIAKLKTIEEQQIEATQKQESIKQKVQENIEKQRREEVLGKNTQKEREAEKDLKKYADEGEKQQIFLLESERVKIEDQIKDLETKKEPEIALQKSKLLSLQYAQETKLKAIIEKEEKIENEQKYIEEKESSSGISSEKKALESRRSDLEKQRQEIEKKRWAIEKDLATITDQIKAADQLSETIFNEKNVLQGKIKDIDNSLRGTYSGVISREEEKRRGLREEQKMRSAELSKEHAKMNERVQREQWAGLPAQAGIPAPIKKGVISEKLKKSFEAEEEQRKKFMQNIEEQSSEENKK